MNEMQRSIIYLSAIPFPNIWANSSQVIKTCEALQRNGVDVELWAQTKKTQKEIFEYYQVRNTFLVRPFTFTKKKDRGIFQNHLTYNGKLLRDLRERRSTFKGVLFARETNLWPVLLWMRFFHGIPFIFEVHRLRKRNMYDGLARMLLLKYASGVVTISQGLADEIRKKYPWKNISVAWCGVDVNRFRHVPSQTEARILCGLSSEASIVGYVGSLQKYEGVAILLKSARRLLQILPSLEILIVGGFEKQIDALRAKLDEQSKQRIHFIPHVPYDQVPRYLAACDVLAIPLLKDEPGASPVKMFEYLFMKKPIIASRLAAIEEVLHDEENAILFTPGDVDACTNAIQEAFENQSLSLRIQERAYQDSSFYTFDARALSIATMISVVQGSISQ